jgi:hypothetical protein
MSALFVLKDEQRRQNCIKYLQSVSIGKPLFVEISSKNRKTRNQESYWHMLLNVVAEHTGDEIDVLKMRLKFEWLPLERVITMTGKEYMMPPSTRNLTKEQYGDLINRTLALGHELGLVMPLSSFYGMEE